jgi:antitoxin YefM
MLETTIDYFQQHLPQEVDRCIDCHEVLRVRRPLGEDFVVLGTQDWRAIEETLYLTLVPGLVESIQQAAQEPLEQGTLLKDLKWLPGKSF